eukprot:TRINITY_DN1124_c0_g1_i2.p1 TRINITY_DN1124_c0_g1~~TRINITY_DN1124_c0_g1_i2.p1  ORF type:complete len:239 (+),score=48.97 TRINITY_DN1124_c0_g1_i2:766-1482(+)
MCLLSLVFLIYCTTLEFLYANCRSCCSGLFPHNYSPIPKSVGVLQLYIKRNKAGFVKKLYPEYQLYLGSNGRHIMMGQRMQLMRSAYYLISTDIKVTDRMAPACLGKLRSNFQETEFDLFGVGENFEKGFPVEQLREQHAAVVYNLGVNEVKSDNKMDILIPKLVNENETCCWKPTSKADNLIERFKLNQKDNMLCFTNKRLLWNFQKNGFTVDFEARATVPSINNLQVVAPHDSTRT